MYKLGYNIPNTFAWHGRIYHSNQYADLKEAYDYVMSAGFDYAETPLGNVMAMSAEDLERAADELNIRVTNGFLPKKLYLHYDEMIEYARKAFPRLAKLGVEKAVFGSGKMRKIALNLQRNKKLEKLHSYLREIAQFAADCGVIIVIEPLNRSETNTFNTVAETCDFVRSVNSPALYSLCDIFHMSRVGEDFSIITKEQDLIRHIHVSEKNRNMPGQPAPGDESYLADFFDLLHTTSYDQYITVEARLTDFEKQCPQAYRALSAYNI